MNKISKGFLVIASGAAAAVAVTLPATAAPTVNLAATSVLAAPSASGGGTGALTASGTGVAELSGNLKGSKIAGVGVLVITDHAGDATISVTGRGVKSSVGNVTTYAGFNGRATITGSNVTVRLAGVRVSLVAAGHGTFFLEGHGRYDTLPGKPGGAGVWSAAGATAVL